MKVSTILLLVIGFSNFQIYLCQQQECIKGPSTLYSGTQSTTSTGKTCQRWDVDTPHKVQHVPKDGGHHNYCRNPDNDSRGTWCYTTDKKTRWDYCDIPKCAENIEFVRTSYDTNTGSSYLRAVNADPESQDYEDKENNLYGKEFEEAQFKALEVSKKNIIFTDVGNKYLGIIDKDTNKVTRHLEGSADAVYAVAHDSMTGNLYYTNMKTKTVMVTDSQFKAHAPIFRSKFGQPRAIAVLTKQRKLVYSVLLKRGSKIIMTEMNGKSPKVLVKILKAKDVTGLAADDERVYWTDKMGYGSKVMSCRHDGSDLQERHFDKDAEYEDIAVHSDYIYVTDSKVRYNYFDEIRYHIKLISKTAKQVFTYTRKEQPSGIAIADEDEEVPEADKFLEDCQRSCGGVCLPAKAGKRYVCRCSPGHFAQRITGECVKLRARLVNMNSIKKRQ